MIETREGWHIGLHVEKQTAGSGKLFKGKRREAQNPKLKKEQAPSFKSASESGSKLRALQTLRPVPDRCPSRRRLECAQLAAALNLVPRPAAYFAR
jgi:hypothetical protein